MWLVVFFESRKQEAAPIGLGPVPTTAIITIVRAPTLTLLPPSPVSFLWRHRQPTDSTRIQRFLIIVLMVAMAGLSVFYVLNEYLLLPVYAIKPTRRRI